MKTLREYIDQLDEISRRDFLKGAGAAAGLAAVGKTSAQPTNSENDWEQVSPGQWVRKNPQSTQEILRGQPSKNSKNISEWADYAVKRAKDMMPKISQRTGWDLDNYLHTNVHQWITNYCADTNCYDIANVIEYCTSTAFRSSGLGERGTLTNMFLTDMRAAMDRFLHSYRSAIIEKKQAYQQHVQAQQKQKQALGGLTENEISTLADALLLYAITKEDNHPSHKQIAQAVGKFIQAYNNKEYVNSMYGKVKPSLDQLRSNPNLFAQEKNKFYRQASSIISNLNSLSSGKEPEFKESKDLEEASDNAIKRIEELTNYK
jgi:hypothetical protein